MNSAVVVIAVIVLLIGAAVASLGFYVAGGIIILIGVIFALTLRTAAEWERAVVLRLGRFAGIRGPGLYFLIPAFEVVYATVDTRRQSTRISAEDTLTADAVSVTMDSIMFWRVQDVKRAATELTDYRGMIAQVAQTSLREVISATTLNDILSQREEMDAKLQEYIMKKSAGWGIGDISVEIRDVKIPPELNDAMSRNAQAEKEKQARRDDTGADGYGECAGGERGVECAADEPATGANGLSGGCGIRAEGVRDDARCYLPPVVWVDDRQYPAIRILLFS
jgi:regulator of protease activity HflC (stomatin/prohibitin superfamily)